MISWALLIMANIYLAVYLRDKPLMLFMGFGIYLAMAVARLATGGA